MQFEIHWQSITLSIPEVIDLYISTLSLLLVASAIAALRVRKVMRDRKNAPKKFSSKTKQFDQKVKVADDSFQW